MSAEIPTTFLAGFIPYLAKRKCPFCDELGRFEVHPRIVIAMDAASDGMGGRVLVLVTCKACGYALTFSARQLGLVSERQGAPPDPSTVS